MSGRRPPTLVQVAQRAGVSLTTASKVINEQGRISVATRARVMQAARDLAYTPNAHARSLITGRTSTVGLIMIDSLTARFAVPVMLGAEDALTQIDLSLITSDARGDDGRLRELASMMERRKVDGVLVVGDNNRLTPSITDLVSVPVVYVYGRSVEADDITCTTDDERGGELVAGHVAELGRRHIAHVTGPRRAISVIDRVTGVRSQLAAHGLRPVGGVRHGAWSQRWGREATEKLLHDRPALDAVVCGSDQIATGVIDAVVRSGRRVPDDVVVTGYDDWDAFVLDAEPPLTSVNMNLERLGQLAGQRLFAAIDGGAGGTEEQRLAPDLVVRASSVGWSSAAQGPAA